LCWGRRIGGDGTERGARTETPISRGLTTGRLSTPGRGARSRARARTPASRTARACGPRHGLSSPP
jgi:hypothetical protein